jgi:hypothetical protein
LLAAATAHDRFSVRLLYFHHFRLEHDLYAFIAEDLRDGFGDLRVLTRQQVLPPLHDRHFRPEAPEHLAELTGDITAAHDDEVRRKLANLHDAGVVQPIDLVESRDRRDPWPGAYVHDHGLRAVPLAVHLDLALAHETGVPPDQLQPFAGAFQPPSHTATPLLHYRVFPIPTCDQARRIMSLSANS